MGNVRLFGVPRRKDRHLGSGKRLTGLPGTGTSLRVGLRLILVALLVLALADVLFGGVHSTVDLLVVLVAGVALGEPAVSLIPLPACSGCSWA
jgi:hypothetical protein